MSILTQEQTKHICDRVMAFSKADECIVTIKGSRNGNIRFARNAVSTAGLADDTQIEVKVAFGKKQGTATINEFDDKSLEKLVRRAEDLARLAPENPEFMPAVAARQFKASNTFVQRTADIDPEFRAQAAAYSIEACRKKGLVAAGFFVDNTSFEAIANSNGVFGHQAATTLEFTCTVRTEDGRGSGWVKRSARDAAKFDPREAADVAIEKALRSVEAKALEPGRYTVVMEPAATSDLLGYMLNGFDARSADEGRSFLSKKGGANRLGDKLFDQQVNIWSDPWDQDVPVLPWDDSMLPRERQALIKDGRVNALDYSLFWAKKKGVRPTAGAGNIIMGGTDKSTAELIANTRKGVLVTRTWYIRMVDPQSVLLTGLTRDGTFYIENGKIKHPIKNFRFNESPVTMLNNIDEIGKPVVIGVGDESNYSMLIPSMKIRDFNFTSLSDAV